MRWLTVVLVLAAAVQADVFVVSVGVEKYDDPGISALSFADADATAVAEAFGKLGTPAAKTWLLTSGAADPAKRSTKANVLRALQTAREKAVGDATLVVFYSGHGKASDQGTYLLPVDANREVLDDTALSMDVVGKLLGSFQGRNVLLLIDACRNDPESGKSDQDNKLDERFAKGLRPKLAVGTKAPSIVALLACDVGQRAWEIPGAEHGAFTYYLLQALSGEASTTDREVKLSQITEYVTKEVAAWAKRTNRVQQPRADNAGKVDFAVGRLSAAAAPAIPSTPAGIQGYDSTHWPPPGWPDYLKDFKPTPGMKYRVCAKDGMPQVLIPAGEVLVDDERKVRLDAYWIDLHEVTIGQFNNMVGRRGARDGDVPAEWPASIAPRWQTAAEYALLTGRLLPTQAEWVHAARGGRLSDRYAPRASDGTAGPVGNLNGDEDGYPTRAPVCSFAANGFGLFDLAGNVAELTADRDGATADDTARGALRAIGDPGKPYLACGTHYGDVASLDPLTATRPLGGWQASIVLRDKVVAEEGDAAGFRCVSFATPTGSLGLAIVEMPRDGLKQFGTETGALIKANTGPTAKAGLQAADVITKIGPYRIGDQYAYRSVVSRLRPGTTIDVGYFRNTRYKTVRVAVEPDPNWQP